MSQKPQSKSGAPKGNQNAAKGDAGRTSRLIIACTPEEKAAWVKASAGSKLSKWVRDSLNRSAKRK